jgi:hypothetical protein
VNTSPFQNIRLIKVDAWGVQGGSVRLQWATADQAALPPVGVVDLNVGANDRPFVSEVAPFLCWGTSAGSRATGAPVAIVFVPDPLPGGDPTAVVYYHLECW